MNFEVNFTAIKLSLLWACQLMVSYEFCVVYDPKLLGLLTYKEVMMYYDPIFKYILMY